MPGLMTYLGLDASGFNRGISAAQSRASSFSRSVTSALAGFVSFSALTVLAKKTIDWASSLRDSADAMSVNVEWLQKMANGASLVGGKMEDIQKMLFELNKSRQEVIDKPNSAAASVFSKAGISQAEIKTASAQNFFDSMVKAYAKGALNMNDLAEVGGKSAKSLAAAFKMGFENDIPILKEEVINQLDDIGDSFASLGKQMMVQLAPAILLAAETISTALNKIESAGAFWGGFVGKLQSIKPKETAPGTGVIDDMADQLKHVWKEASNEGVGAMINVESEFEQFRDKMKAAAAEMAAFRRQKESAAPVFEKAKTPDQIKKESKEAAGKMGIDALQSAGAYVRGDSKLLTPIQQSERHLRELLSITKQNPNTISGF